MGYGGSGKGKGVGVWCGIGIGPGIGAGIGRGGGGAQRNGCSWSATSSSRRGSPRCCQCPSPRNIAITTDWFPRGPFFRRFAGPWLTGRMGHCSFWTRGRSVPLGVCLRRDRSCDFVTGLRLRCFGRLKARLGGLCVCAGGHCSRCVYNHRLTDLLKVSPVLSLVS